MPIFLYIDIGIAYTYMNLDITVVMTKIVRLAVSVDVDCIKHNLILYVGK